MNKFSLIGVVANEPQKAYISNRRQMYGFTVHCNSKNFTECIKVVIEENDLVSVKQGHKYFFKGKIISRMFNGKQKVYLLANIIVPTNAEDENCLEVVGKKSKNSEKMITQQRCGSRYLFTIETFDKPMNFVHAKAFNEVSTIAYEIPVGTYIYARGKVQTKSKVVDGEVKTVSDFIVYYVRLANEREVKNED